MALLARVQLVIARERRPVLGLWLVHLVRCGAQRLRVVATILSIVHVKVLAHLNTVRVIERVAKHRIRLLHYFLIPNKFVLI